MPALRRKWSPHPKQRVVLTHPARFRVVAAGRRFGKTTLARHAAFETAWQTPESLVWWVAPTYGDANELGYDPLRRLIPESAMSKEPKRTPPRKIYLTNGSVISFRSGEREDSLRGRGLDFLVLDEAGSVPDHSWKAELRPSLMDEKAPMLAIGTPRGRNWFEEWFRRGQDAEVDNTKSFRGTPYDNPHVADEEIEEMRAELPERVFRQEVLAEFLSDEGAVFGDVRARNVAAFDIGVATGQADSFITGIDLARTQNYTVAVTLTGSGKAVGFLRDRGGTWGVLRSKMEGYLENFAPGTVYIDASRDNAVIEELDRNVPHRVEPVKFGGGKKKDLIENLAARLETGDIHIPGTVHEGERQNEPADEFAQLVTELEAYQFETTSHGNVTYGPPAGVNDDAVDALALAAQKAKVMNATW